MAWLPADFCASLHVRHAFNSATDRFDVEGQVSHVLSQPQAYGGTVLPKGSVAVANGQQTMWISQEHLGAGQECGKKLAGVMLRKVEKPQVPLAGGLDEVDSPTTSTPNWEKVSCSRVSFGDALSEVLAEAWPHLMPRCIRIDVDIDI